jgi:hypothetical protein
MAVVTGHIYQPFVFISAVLYMSLKKLIIIILAFISFRCGDDIPDGVVDPVNENLHITSLNVPVDSVYNNPDKPLYISFRVNNPQNLKSAYYNLESPDGNEIFSKEALMDIKDTLTADDSTGDGVYSGKINLDSNNLNGQYKLDIFLENLVGEIFKVAGNSFVFDNGKGNSAPAISDLTAPDTLIVGSSSVIFTITIRVSDPDGQSDIRKVYFKSYRPDGTTSGSTFTLKDDGQTYGDVTAGDGIYTITPQLPSTTARGTWRFEFKAEDRRKAESNIINHLITITD